MLPKNVPESVLDPAVLLDVVEVDKTMANMSAIVQSVQ